MSTPSSRQAAGSCEPSAEVTMLGTGQTDASRVRPAAPVPDPTVVGRYAVVRRLGAGAMGAVYEARDPDLERPVALKLVRGDLSESAQQRMHREALALARLSHPHVVRIYEIGQSDGRTFIAMELVQGQTLERWQQRTPRPGWREALRLYAQAGEGLAAAHAEGLVHRDFKPSNCMLGDDGRVRVVDFGLAKGADEDTETQTLPDAAVEAPLPLTRTGAVVGTPAYMPPEQLGRGPVDAAADQFSFCVSLYEALYGERPFAGHSLGELLHAVVHGELQPVPRDASVPGWVRKVIVRGLAYEPAARWPSMRALLDALADDPIARARTRGALAGGLALAAGVGAVLWWSDDPGCGGAQGRLEGVWDDARRIAVEQALLGTKLSFAPDTWTRVRTSLDGYAAAWVVAHEQACEATRAGEQSEALMDLRMACLDERRQHLRATVDELAQADPAVVQRAVPAVLGLPTLDRCADADALMADVPPPEDPAVAARVEALRAVLVQADAKRRAGRHAEALALAEPVVAEAGRLGYEPLVAEAWLDLGWHRDAGGDYEGAIEAFERAYAAAVAERMFEPAAGAATQLVWVLGERLSRFEEAHRWVASAEPLSRAAGSDDARALLVNALGVVARAQGELTEARTRFEQALAIQEGRLARDDADRHRRAVATLLNNLGVIALEQQRLPEARAHYRRALVIEEEVLGAGHPLVATTLINLGVVARRMGELDEAREHAERAVSMLEEALGPSHPEVASALVNRGTAALARGELASARADYERVLPIFTKTLGPEHPSIAVVIGNLGDLAVEERDYPRALEHQRRAVAILDAALGPEHPSLVGSLNDLGLVYLELGQPAEARATAERVVALEGRDGVPVAQIGRARFHLARAYEAAGDRERARTEARLARTAYAAADEDTAAERAELDAWLAERGGP